MTFSNGISFGLLRFKRVSKDTELVNKGTYLPTISSSISDGFFRIRVQISIVKMVDDELKIEVKELIKAASMTDNIKPVKPKS